MSEPTVLRVTGHATLESPADAARLTLTVHRCGPTAAAARRAAVSAVTALEKVLARHSPVVVDQQRSVLHVDEHPEGDVCDEYCGRAEITVTVAATGPVSALIVAAQRVKGVHVGEIGYLLRDPDKVRHFARKSAVADAQAAARAIAETLGGEVIEVDWVCESQPPVAPSGSTPTLRTSCSVTAQFSIRTGATPSTSAASAPTGG